MILRWRRRTCRERYCDADGTGKAPYDKGETAHAQYAAHRPKPHRKMTTAGGADRRGRMMTSDAP